MRSIFKKLRKYFQPEDSTNYYPHEPRVYNYHPDSASRLVKKQEALVEDAYESLCFNDEDFEIYAKPLIKWLSNYILLLPASEYYHHTLPGSLFYHSLQTANFAAYFASNDPRCRFYESAQDRPSAMVFIPFAAWISGLTHDMSKAGSDMIIKARKVKDNKRVGDWQPDIEPINNWCERNNVEAYTAIFVKDRDPTLSNNLRSFYLNQAAQLIPKSWQHFSKFNAILNSSLDSRRPLYSIIKKADERSLFLDKNRFSKEPNIMRESAIFMSALQDMDSLKGALPEFDLYYRSDWAIHIPYPQGVRRIIDHINRRYTNMEAYQAIKSNNIDIWINRLGHSYSLLQPHYHDRTFERNQQIHPYVYPLKIVKQGVELTINCISIKQFGFILANGDSNTVESANFFGLEAPEQPRESSVGQDSIVQPSSESDNTTYAESEVDDVHSSEPAVEEPLTIANTDLSSSNLDSDETISFDTGRETNVPQVQSNDPLPKYIDPALNNQINSININEVSDTTLDIQQHNIPSEQTLETDKNEPSDPYDNGVVESKNSDNTLVEVETSQKDTSTFVLNDLQQLATELNEAEFSKYLSLIPNEHPLKSYLSNNHYYAKHIPLCIMLFMVFELIQRGSIDLSEVNNKDVKRVVYLKENGLYLNSNTLSMRASLFKFEGIEDISLSRRISGSAENLYQLELDSHAFGKRINNDVYHLSCHLSAALLSPVKNIIKALIKEEKVRFHEF